jgi:hypothetical protein
MRNRRALAAIAVLAVLTASASLEGAGTVTATHAKQETIRQLRLAWTSDAAGAVSGTLVHASGELVRVVFIPGTGGVVPTTLYDVTIEDADGLDVLAGKGANLSEVNKTQIVPLIGDGTTTQQRVALSSTLELKVANAGNAKQGTVVLYYR